MRSLARWCSCLLLTLAFTCPLSLSASGSRTMVALLDFDTQGTGFPNEDMGRIVVEWLTTALVRTGRVDVVERALLRKVLDEQKLGLTGMIDRETAARIGDVLGAKVIVTGSVISLGSKIEVNARLIRTATAAVVAAETVKGEGLETLERLVQEMAQKIVSDFPLEGYVVAVDPEAKECTIDLGKEVGVRRGMLFEVYTDGEEIRHPITGEVLNIQKIPVGTVRASQIGPKTSRCEVVRTEEGKAIAYGQKIASLEVAPPTPVTSKPAAPEAQPRPLPTPPDNKPMFSREEGGRISVGTPGCGRRSAPVTAAPTPVPSSPPTAVARVPSAPYVATPAPSILGWRALAQWSSGLGGSPLLYPVDVAVAPGTGAVYVLDLKRSSVECFDADGRPTARFDVTRSAPMGLAVGPDGGVWVAATAMHQVLKFDARGEVVLVVGRPGRGTGELVTPTAVGLDAEGNLLVAELKNYRIQKFDPQGKSQWVTGGPGKLAGQFVYVSGIAVEDSGAFYVCDRELGRVDAFDAQGTYLRTLISGLADPIAVHLTKTRKLLVAESGRHRILVIDTDGKVLETVGQKGREVGAFAAPQAAAGLGTKIYVADTGNRRVQVFEK